MENKGSIEVICGPMFAGKSEEIIRRVRRLEYAKKKYLVSFDFGGTSTMTNKEIRRRAWELCREKFGLILSATFVISLVSSLSGLLAYSQSGLGSLVSLVLSALSMIISLGIIRYMLDVWHDKTPALSVLFSMKRKVLSFLGFVLLITLLCIGIALAVSLPAAFALFMVFPESDLPIIITAVLALLPMLWFVIRFEMAATCMVIRPSLGAISSMRISWRASKGNAWRLFCQTLIAGLPTYIAQVLLTGYSLYLTLTGQMLNTVGSLLLDAASIMLTALLSGYVYLSIHPLHRTLRRLS